MPFIPFILLLAWQAFSKSASFALGWATALFFGQIPGDKGRVLSIVSLVSAAWIIVAAGAFLPLLAGIVAQEAGIIGSDSVEIEPWQLAAIAGALLVAPPAATAFAEWAQFERDRRWDRWLRRIPVSYLVIVSLGVSVLQMVVLTPILAVRRMRRGRTLLQIPLVVRDGAFDELADDICRLLGKLTGEARRTELKGPMSWPMRTIGPAARYLLGSVVRHDPIHIRSGETEIALHATNVSIIGPKQDAYQVRAAVEKELAFSTAFLTWSDVSQAFEEELKDLHERSDADPERLVRQLDDLQRRMDEAQLKSDEWNVLYRLRLQMERDARLRRDGEASSDGTPSERLEEPVGAR